MKFRKVIRPSFMSDAFLLLGVIIFLWTADMLHSPWSWEWVFWVLIFALRAVPLGITFWNSLVIDDEGITRRYFLKSSRVRWADMARLEKIDGFLSTRIVFNLHPGVPQPPIFDRLDGRYGFYTKDIPAEKLFKTVHGLWEREHAAELSHA